jgi:uncharacterized protein (DUF1778 family)
MAGEDAELLPVQNERDTKTKQLNLRVRAGQLAFWEDAAAEEGVTLSAWIKRICTQAAFDTFAEIDEKFGHRKPK